MTQERGGAVAAQESVFEFRTELHRRDAVRTEQGPALRLHLEREGRSLPSRLAWTGADGAHSAVAFAAGMGGFLGVHRAADGSVAQLRGRIERRRGYPALPAGLTAADVLTFDTHREDAPGDWRRAGRLRLLLDDGRGCPLRDLEWAEESGAEASVSLDPDRSGFLGYLREAGQGAVGYRGFAVPGRPVVSGDDLVKELEQFGRQALGVVEDLVGRLGGWLGGRGPGDSGGAGGSGGSGGNTPRPA